MGHRLLVVDSDRRFLQDHKASLESAFDVDFRHGTEGSLSHLESGEFAAVLLCVEASENKGYSLCSAIRRSPALADLKVALISAKATEEEYARHQSLKGKADLYLHKPIRPNALVTALTPLVPLKPDDPDNPLGDLGGVDLGDEWLESLKTELEVEPSPHDPAPASAPARSQPFTPVAAMPVPLPSAASLLGLNRPLLPLPQPTLKLPPMVENAGLVELLEARIRDLETKLVVTSDALEQRDHGLDEVRRQEAAVTRELDEKTQQAMDLMDTNQLLQAQLAEAREDLARLLGSERDLQERAAELEAARNETREARAAKDQVEQSLQAQLAEARAELERRIQSEQSLAARTGELEAAWTEAVTATTARDQAGQSLQAQLDEARAERERLAQTERDLQWRIGELEAERDGAVAGREGALAAKEQLEQSLRAQLAEAEATLEQQRQAAQAAQVRAGELEAGWNEAVAARESAVEADREAAREASRQLEQLLRADLAEAAASVQRLTQSEQGLQAWIQELEISREEVRSAEAGAAAARDAALADRDAAAAARDAALADRDAAAAARDQLAQDLAALERRLADAEVDHERQQMELMAAIDDRDAQMGRMNTLVEALREQVQQLEQGRQAAEAKVEAGSRRLQSLAEQLAELEFRAHQALDAARAETP